MTESELAAIEARAEAATEGPCEFCVRDGITKSNCGDPALAALLEDIPALVAEVRRLNKLVANCQHAVRVSDQGTCSECGEYVEATHPSRWDE